MTAIVAIDRGVIRYYGMGVVIGIVILAVLAIFPGTWSRSPFFFVLLGLAGCEASWWLTTAQLESITQFWNLLPNECFGRNINRKRWGRCRYDTKWNQQWRLLGNKPQTCSTQQQQTSAKRAIGKDEEEHGKRQRRRGKWRMDTSSKAQRNRIPSHDCCVYYYSGSGVQRGFLFLALLYISKGSNLSATNVCRAGGNHDHITIYY